MFSFFLKFYRHERLFKGSNYTFIALISKVDNPPRLFDFYQISFVECMNKLLIMLLVNRLNLFADDVILETQICFVKGIQKLDGILVVNEVVDEARKRENGLILFRVDFEKTCDFVEWRYLNVAMSTLSS